jgi:RHS repeat-associated protein
MKRTLGFTTCLLVVILNCGVLSGVTFTVVPPPAPDFNTYAGGPFDLLNLGTLEFRGVIPIIHKAGRGIPFSFDLSYDSRIWIPVGASGSQIWTPVTSTSSNYNYWGWIGLAKVSSGTPYISYAMTSTSGNCGQYGNQPYTMYQFSNFVYHDELGLSHSLVGSGVYYNSPGPPNCPPSGPQPPFTQQGQTGDGSGTTSYITLNAGYATAYLVTRDGKTIYPSIVVNQGAPQGSFYETDRNGNKITVSNGTYTDTLGQQALIAAGVQPNNTNFTYSGPSGFVSYVVSYKGYTIKTAFGCNGVTDYTSPSTVYLVDKVKLPDNTFYQFAYENTPGYNDGVHVTARLYQVTLPTGGTIQYQYTGGTNGINCSDGSTVGLTRSLSSPGGQWTYARSTTSPLTTTVTDPNRNQTVLQFQSGNSYYETQRQVYQGSSASGTLLLTTTTCYNGNTTNCPGTAVTAPVSQRAVTLQYPGTAVLATQTITTYDTALGLPTEIDTYPYGQGSPGSTALKKISIAYSSIASHPPTTVIVHDGNGSLLSETTYTYDEYALQPTTSTPMHQAGINSGNVTTVSAAVSFNTSSQAVSGWLTRHFKYYDTGELYQGQDLNGQWTTYNYSSTGSCGNSFPTSYTLPITGLSTLTSTTWNCTAGIATATSDINGNTITTNYADPYFWRPASIVAPYTSNTNTTTINFQYTPITVDSQMLLNGGASVEQLTTIGTFGQPLYSQQREGPSSNNWDSTQMLYDSLLRPYQSTMPCVTTSGNGCPSAAKATSTFDALGRVTQRTDGGNPTPGWVKYTYTQNDVLQQVGPVVAGENTKQKQLEYDALERLTSVCEKTNGPGYGVCGQQTSSPNGYFTTYAYGTTTINSLLYTTLTVTQNVQSASSHQTRVYTYDLAGRLISEQNPENGTTSYTYDSDSSGTCSGTYPGDLVKLVDAKGNKICYQYDLIHRNTSITYPSSGPDASVTQSKTFIYDNATFNGTAMLNAKGRLVEAYTGSVSSKTTDEFFSYSVRGELTETWECTPHSGTNGCASVSNYYHVIAGFFENGALKSLSSSISGLPSQTYGIDPMGRTNGVTASSGQNPVNSAGTSYDLANFKTTITYGSGDSDVITLDQYTGRMKQYKFNVGTQNVTGNLTWNPNGSLGTLAITNPLNSLDTQTCSYTHDDLSRISSVGCLNGSTHRWDQTFTYDAFGNINKAVPTGGTGTSFHPTYDTSKNWITALPGITPVTDGNGAMTYDGSHNYTWDAEGKLHSVDASPSTCSTSGECLTYDALGRMVEKAIGSTYTQIVYGPPGRFATMNGQTLISAFIPTPGAQVVYTSASLNTTNKIAYYRHADHLGSSRLATTPTQTLYSSTAYAAFGEAYSQSGTTDLSFTGQEQDTVPRIHDFLFRRFVPAQGRWLSPDPAGLMASNPANPQSWNRYAYVGNSPMALIDPLGLETCDLIGSYGTTYSQCTGAPCDESGCEDGGSPVPVSCDESGCSSSTQVEVTDWVDPYDASNPSPEPPVIAIAPRPIPTIITSITPVMPRLCTLVGLGNGAQFTPNQNAQTPVRTVFQPEFASRLTAAIQAMNASGIIPQINQGTRTLADQLYQIGTGYGAKVSWHTAGGAVDFNGLSHNATAISIMQANGFYWGQNFNAPKEPWHWDGRNFLGNEAGAIKSAQGCFN